MGNFNKERNGTGTRQISDQSVNLMFGCGHDCKYCYAAHDACQKNKISKRSDWPRVSKSYKGDGIKEYPRYDGVVMYPTRHDIEPQHLPHHLTVIRNLIRSGNQILLTTKAHYECVDEICFAFDRHKDQIGFMFTITSMNEKISRFWEPYAPCPYERLASLMLAHNNGFRTSVIVEPMLEGPEEAKALYHRVAPFVTDDIWIGKMNSPTVRVDTTIPENDAAVKRVLWKQSNKNIQCLYEELRGLKKIKWKDSILRIVDKQPAEPSQTHQIVEAIDFDEDYEFSELSDEDGNMIIEITPEILEQLYQNSLS